MQGTFLEPDMFFYNQGSIFYIFGRMGRRCKKKHRASICDLKSAESAAFFLHVSYKKCFHLCRNWVDEQAASIQVTVYSQSSKRVRISWQLGRFSGSAQQSAPNEKQ
jgi:hypothetical protein